MANPQESITVLIEAKKYSQAADRVRKEIDAHPDDPGLRLLQGIALLRMEKYDKAVKVLERSARHFPANWQVLSMLGQAYHGSGDWMQEVDTLRQALHLSSDAQVADQALLHYSLGEALWARHDRDGAHKEWHEALRLDPECEPAKEAIDERTNAYGEPKAPARDFDDLYHFMDIHTGRYFNLAGSKKFRTTDEANRVTAAIMDAWNEHIAGSGNTLDTMTAAAKTELFSSITIRFDQVGSGTQAHPAEEESAIDELKDGILDEMNSLFPFLPPDGIMLIPFAAPAMEHAGLSGKRLGKIMAGAIPSKKEEEVLVWGHELVDTIAYAIQNDGTGSAERAMNEALDIAEDHLDPDTAGAIVGAIEGLVREFLKNGPPAGWTKRDVAELLDDSPADIWFEKHQELIKQVGKAAKSSSKSLRKNKKKDDSSVLGKYHGLALQLAGEIMSAEAAVDRQEIVDGLMLESPEDIVNWLLDLPYALASAGMVQEAVQMQKAWADITERANFLGDRIVILAEAGLAIEVREQRAQLMREFPDDVWVQIKIGDADMALGDVSSAEQQYRKALALATVPYDREGVLERLIPLLNGLGRNDEARALKRAKK